MYTLKLGNIWLAPRVSITVEEPRNFEKLITNQRNECAICASSVEREYTFHICIKDQSYTIKASIDALLCNLGVDTTLYRRVQDEIPLEMKIKSGRTKIINVVTQYLCDPILCLELVVRLIESPDSISPLPINITIPTPTTTGTLLVNAVPLSITTSLVTPNSP